MRDDSRIDSDLDALADETRRGLPTLADTARAVTAARARPTEGGFMHFFTIRRTVFAAAILAAVLLCPVPFSRTGGYDLIVRGADGRTATVRVATRDVHQAERRAAALRRHGAEVTIEPHVERVWGSVYAMAQEKLFAIDVELDGKTDEQVEAEIRDQLAQAGWTPTAVEVRREPDGTRADVSASDGSGRQIRLVRKGGDDGGRLRMEEPELDTARDPGMTDDQLRDKIVRQLQARGLDADVTVEGDRVLVRATHRPAP
jgi:hypothetical protein